MSAGDFEARHLAIYEAAFLKVGREVKYMMPPMAIKKLKEREISMSNEEKKALYIIRRQCAKAKQITSRREAATIIKARKAVTANEERR